jgi:hypothetical protein
MNTYICYFFVGCHGGRAQQRLPGARDGTRPHSRGAGQPNRTELSVGPLLPVAILFIDVIHGQHRLHAVHLLGYSPSYTL